MDFPWIFHGSIFTGGQSVNWKTWGKCWQTIYGKLFQLMLIHLRMFMSFTRLSREITLSQMLKSPPLSSMGLRLFLLHKFHLTKMSSQSKPKKSDVHLEINLAVSLWHNASWFSKKQELNFQEKNEAMICLTVKICEVRGKCWKV